MNIRLIRLFFTLFIIVLFVLNCCSGNEEEQTTENVKPENNLSYSGWERSTLEEQGLNSEILTEMMEFIEEKNSDNGGNGVDSVIIIKNAYLVFEEYFNGQKEDSLHNIHSCTKSITSALIGIAINNGHIKSVNEKVLDFFPEYEFENMDERKKAITIEHLLTMSSGIEWDEFFVPYTSRENDFIDTIYNDDWVKYTLDKRMVNNPGEIYEYNTGGSHILSAILQKATGMDTLSYAKKYLFTPLDISENDVYWPISPKGIYTGGHGVEMKPSDMAKIGLLYHNKGMWNGKQIIPKEWIEKSGQPLIKTNVKNYRYNYIYDYGYQWWVDKRNIKGAFFASGYNNQLICVINELNMVVVLTASLGEYNSDTMPYLNQIIKGYIIPSTK